MFDKKSFGFAFGIVWGIMVFWSFLLAVLGIGQMPYQVINQFYLGYLDANMFGLVTATVVGLIDGFIGGFIFAWIYNKCQA